MRDDRGGINVEKRKVHKNRTDSSPVVTSFMVIHRQTWHYSYSEVDRYNLIVNTYQGCSFTGFSLVPTAGLDSTIAQMEQCQWYREAKVWKLSEDKRS